MIGRVVIGGVLLGLALAVCGQVTPVRAQSLEALLPELIRKHERIHARQADVLAAKNRAREALGDWFPILEPTLNHGLEIIDNPHGDSTSLPQSEFDLALTQLLWDFGATNAAVEKARLELADAELQLADARDDLLQEAVEAYVNLIRDHKTLAFASQSRDNIMKQAELEDARVETGGGLSTDVLQAKKQLAGATAREISSRGTLISSTNRFKAVFDAEPDVERLVPVKLPVEHLPKTLAEAVERTKRNNADLVLDRLAAAIARKDVHNTFSTEFLPKIEGSVEQKWKNNVGGTTDLKREFLAKVEMTMSLNLGLSQVNTLRAAQSDVVAASKTVADTLRRVVEETRNAWQELNTARATAASLQNQANIAAAFLELARQERELGQRSLIDILSGETDLINAQSDAESAQADVVIAAYKLLNVTGALTMNTFQSGRKTPVPVSADTGILPRPDRGALFDTSTPRGPKGLPIPDESSPLTNPAPDPDEVQPDELTRQAVRPFNEFFGEVKTIFNKAFEENKTVEPGKKKSAQ